jgi:uncharacterized membrane-anchored protein YitT (DUF2179 family)
MANVDKSRRMIRNLRDYALLVIGSIIQAIALILFMVPANLVSGGLVGLSQIINYFAGWPIGLMFFLGNIPLFFLGWRYLGGKNFAFRTSFSIVVYSLSVDLLTPFLPSNGLSGDTLLNALYGGVIGGIGLALVYRGKGTSGGMDILARIISHRRNVPISQSYLLTDSATIFMGGLVFGWEKALYAIVMLYTAGISSETISQGPRVVRTAMIITNKPIEVSNVIMAKLNRGVTNLPAKGMYTGESRNVLYCVIARSEVERLKSIVAEADQSSFMVIGHGYEALGEGFQPLPD